jgi:hypothetical protein
MGTSRKMGQFRATVFRLFLTDFPWDLPPEFPGTLLSSMACPACLRTPRNSLSENVMKAIDSAFAQWRWRAAASESQDVNFPCSDHMSCIGNRDYVA